MSSLAPSTADAAIDGAPPPIAGLEPLKPVARRWPALLAGGLTIAMVAGLGYQLLHRGLAGLTDAVPTNPLFYVFFVLFYLSLPVGDFIIFRRLWRIPASGLVALLKKRIANDVLVNYSGEAYFYAWARQRTKMVAAPFGAVKDVSILSAMAGNAQTLLLVALALPFARDLLPPDYFRAVMWCASLLVAITTLLLIFSRRVFSLPRRGLWRIFGVHSVRVVASNLFTALAWHYALPDTSIGVWLLLAAAKMLVFRLPFLPNKEVAFPLVANMLVGGMLLQHLAFFGALTLATNLVLLVVFGVRDILKKEKSW